MFGSPFSLYHAGTYCSLTPPWFIRFASQPTVESNHKRKTALCTASSADDAEEVSKRNDILSLFEVLALTCRKY